MFVVVTILMSLTLVNTTGCGGGKKSPPPISPPIDNTEKVERLTVNYPPAVKSGEEITIELTTNKETTDKILEQADKDNIVYEPYNPTLEIKKLQNNRFWKIKFPKVNKDTIYTIYFLFVNTRENIRFEAQIQILVRKTEDIQPPPQPPQPNPEPPSIQIVYPWEDNKVNVVGDNVILTVKGYTYSRSNGYVNKVEAFIDNEKVAETIPNYDYFELDINRFGNIKGNKQVIIRATTTDNAIGEYRLNIIYDNNLLYSLAVEFLRKYSSIDGKLVRYGGDITEGPYKKPVRIQLEYLPDEYHILVQKACDFWTKYTGIQFLLTKERPTPDLAYIYITPKFDSDPGYAASVSTGHRGNSYEITYGDIILYKEWLTYSEYTKIVVIAHEIGHVLVTLGHTDEGDIMDYRGPTRDLFHTYQQLAMKIKYSKNPGENL